MRGGLRYHSGLLLYLMAMQDTLQLREQLRKCIDGRDVHILSQYLEAFHVDGIVQNNG